jgi:hypothetical protein
MASKVAAWMVVAHIVLAGLVLVLAAKSRTTQKGCRIGLSPVAWLFGSFASYAVGLVVFWFVK